LFLFAGFVQDPIFISLLIFLFEYDMRTYTTERRRELINNFPDFRQRN
jgi:hypothetical protein